MQARPFKGQSKLSFLQNYTVVDIETTGFSSVSAEILEISAIRVRKNVPAATFSSLIRPQAPIHPFITNLTGISDETVQSAPSKEVVLSDFAKFLGKDDIVGYNVNFDINFLYDNLLLTHGVLLDNSFVDVLRIARRMLVLPNYRQTTVAAHMGISVDGAHRALRDCEICNAIYNKLRDIRYKEVASTQSCAPEASFLSAATLEDD